MEHILIYAFGFGFGFGFIFGWVWFCKLFCEDKCNKAFAEPENINVEPYNPNDKNCDECK